MTLFDMFNKAAGLTEDAKRYNTGDISEKTGLQKQPDGSWKPPKQSGNKNEKNTSEKKERKTSNINPHEEVKEHLNASKYYKQKAKGFTKTDPSYKKYLAKAEEYENKAKAAADDYGLDFSEFIDDSAPLTADTKIKLSQIKTTDDAKRYNIGDISEKTGLQKTANGWVRPKTQKTSRTEQKQEKNKNSSGKPSAELVAKRNARAEARKKQAKSTAATNSTKLQWEPVKGKDNMEIAKHNGNNIKLEKSIFGYYWSAGTHSWYPSARGNATTREEAIKQAIAASEKHPGVVTVEGMEFKRNPSSEYNKDSWVAADNGNIMRISYNIINGSYEFRVHEEGRDRDSFKTGEARTREDAMKQAKKASDSHQHSGFRPIRIPYGAAFGNTTKWNNEDMYASKPRNTKKEK